MVDQVTASCVSLRFRRNATCAISSRGCSAGGRNAITLAGMVGGAGRLMAAGVPRRWAAANRFRTDLRSASNEYCFMAISFLRLGRTKTQQKLKAPALSAGARREILKRSYLMRRPWPGASTSSRAISGFAPELGCCWRIGLWSRMNNSLVEFLSQHSFTDSARWNVFAMSYTGVRCS